MKYFITYGDKNYEQSKQRLAKQAEDTGLFEKIILYDRADVSPEITHSPLFGQKKGGGYWIWKPDVVATTLQVMNDGDILVYADSGCTVLKDKEWQYFFNLLQTYNGIVFMINGTNEQYSRKNIIEYFSGIGKHWHKRYQIAATFFLLKKTPESLAFVNEWRDIMLNKPELVMDISDEERCFENPKFIDNRHDQSIFTALSYKYQQDYRIKILFNRFEGGKDRFRGQAVIASRISDKGIRSNDRTLIKNILLYLIAKPYRYLYSFYWRAKG